MAHVEEVTMDMWAPYVGVVREAFGTGVAITIDRFHVMKNFQECLTGARRELQRQMSGPEREHLKGSRWLWVTNPENLTPEDQKKLEALKEQFPTLRQIAEQRESLRAIFEDRKIQSPAVGQQRLQGWLEQVEALGIKALGALLQDREKLAGQDRQLFPESIEQRSYRRIEPWAARRHLACLWNGELSEFPPACPALLWPWFGLIIPQTSRRAEKRSCICR